MVYACCTKLPFCKNSTIIYEVNGFSSKQTKKIFMRMSENIVKRHETKLLCCGTKKKHYFRRTDIEGIKLNVVRTLVSLQEAHFHLLSCGLMNRQLASLAASQQTLKGKVHYNADRHLRKKYSVNLTSAFMTKFNYQFICMSCHSKKHFVINIT